MTTPTVQITADTEVRDGKVILPCAAVPAEQRLPGQLLTLVEPVTGWQATGRIAATDTDQVVVDVPAPPPTPERRFATMTIAPAPARPGWADAPTALAHVIHARPARIPQPPRPRPLVVIPIGSGDLKLQAWVQDAVARWYETEFQRPMPAGCAVQEPTEHGPALAIYARPMTGR